MGMDCVYLERMETSGRSFNSDYYIEAEIMNEPKPMADQMRDRTDVLEKALGSKLWCWQCCGQPHIFQIGFEDYIHAYLDFRERDPLQDLAAIKLALTKGIKILEDKLKKVEEYEHNRQGR